LALPLVTFLFVTQPTLLNFIFPDLALFQFAVTVPEVSTFRFGLVQLATAEADALKLLSDTPHDWVEEANIGPQPASELIDKSTDALMGLIKAAKLRVLTDRIRRVKTNRRFAFMTFLISFIELNRSATKCDFAYDAAGRTQGNYGWLPADVIVGAPETGVQILNSKGHPKE
jgi:hypothetical protein